MTIVWLCDLWPHIFHTHTLRTCWLFWDRAFSCRVCSAPRWDADDASFIAPQSRLEQGDSSTAGSHREHQLCCETLSFNYNLFCGVALWQSWEYERHTHKKNPLWHQACWDVVSGWQLNCPLAIYYHRGSMRFMGNNFTRTDHLKCFNWILWRHRSLWYVLASFRDWKLFPVVAELIYRQLRELKTVHPLLAEQIFKNSYTKLVSFSHFPAKEASISVLTSHKELSRNTQVSQGCFYV